MSKTLILHGAKNPHALKICKRAGVIDKILCFTDNNTEISKFMEYDVYTLQKAREAFPGTVIQVCNLVTGSASARLSVYKQIKDLGFSFTSLIDSSVDLYLVEYGASCYIQEGVSLQAGVVLNDNVSVHAGTVIGHETTIGHSSFIAHGCSISGEVSVGNNVFIGAGAAVHPRKTIGTGSIVGAGSVVTKNIPDYEVWIGNPARRLKTIRP